MWGRFEFENYIYLREQARARTHPPTRVTYADQHTGQKNSPGPLTVVLYCATMINRRYQSNQSMEEKTMKKAEILNRPMTNSKWANMMTSDMVKLSKGNKKLKPTNEVKFLIWNLPSIRSCPFATAQCKANCYSIKSESQYGLPCIESRERHYNASLRPDFAKAMIEVIERYYKHACKNGKSELFVRIHESGDFYSQQYFDKWAKICKGARK